MSNKTFKPWVVVGRCSVRDASCGGLRYWGFVETFETRAEAEGFIESARRRATRKPLRYNHPFEMEGVWYSHLEVQDLMEWVWN